MQNFKNVLNFNINDAVPVAGLEGFRALKFSRLESSSALKWFGQIGEF